MLIPSDKFDSDLLFWVCEQRNQVHTPDSAISSILSFLESIAKISFDEQTNNPGLESIETKRLSVQELTLVNEHCLCESENLYVRAICLDLVRKEVKDKREMSVKASDAYLELFAHSEYHEPWYLLRSITVRKIKMLFTEEYLARICKLSVHVYPAWMQRLAELLLKSYTKDQLKEFVSILEARRREVEDDFYRDGERYLLNALLSLGCMSKSVWSRETALSFEKEVDYTNEHAEPNTFYPHLAGIVQEAYQAINQVKEEYPDDYARIRQKLIDEQQKHGVLISKGGVKVTFGFSADKLELLNETICKMDIKDTLDLILYLKGFPFPLSELYASSVNDLKENSFTAQYMGSVTVGDDGRILGTAEPEEAAHIYVHKQLRMRLIQIIRMLLYRVLQQEPQIDDEMLYQVLAKLPRASYVEDGRFLLWAKGLIAGCKGDMITASHILVPQIEHALKVKLASYKGCILKLEKDDHQDEPDLFSTLKSLEPYFKAGLYDEFRFFFNHGCDENFRNRLCHGIASLDEIERLGIYVWWLALKMFFCEDEMFIQEYPPTNQP